MFILDYDACSTLNPIIGLLKKGVIPLIQAAIIVALIVLLIIDLGKAVMAGKEDEIKSAQKLAIKRVVYALVVFLVPWLVNIAIGLLANADGVDEGKGKTAWQCWDNYGKKTTAQNNNCSKEDEQNCYKLRENNPDVYWWNSDTCKCEHND